MSAASLPNGRKPGRPKDQLRAKVRALFSDWSDRTFARYWKSHLRLQFLREAGAITFEEWQRILSLATRPNGSINVSLLDEITEDIAAMHVARAESEGEA